MQILSNDFSTEQPQLTGHHIFQKFNSITFSLSAHSSVRLIKGFITIISHYSNINIA